MSREELQALRKFLDKNLGRGSIRASSSPVASPVLFVKKPNGDLCLCVDYKKLNAITIKNRYPLPLINETLDRLASAKYYTKLDIITAFNQLCIAPGHKYFTAFNTCYGQYSSLVMPFGLCNGSSLLQHYINDTLFKILDRFCTAYLDDILVYSNTLSKHRNHVCQVLSRLEATGL